MTDSWRPIIEGFFKALAIWGPGAIIHELGHYATTIASGGKVLKVEFDPISGVVMEVDAPEWAIPIIRLAGGLSEAAYYAFLSNTDDKFLIPAFWCLGTSYSEVTWNQFGMFLFQFLTQMSVLSTQIFFIPEEGIAELENSGP